MEVKDIMLTKFISFQADDSLDTVLGTLIKNHINSAPVFKEDEFLGILSDKTIIKYFSPKKFLHLWSVGKKTNMQNIKKFRAGLAIKRPAFKLKSDQPLSSILSKLSSAHECIPVFHDHDSELVGIVRTENVLRYILKEMAKDSYIQSKDPNMPKKDSKYINTVVDNMLWLINQNEKISAKKLANELGISIATVEELGETLRKHNLIKINYSFLKGAEFERLDHEKK